jgi:quercetin dioxygenase-like cupin family protein
MSDRNSSESADPESYDFGDLAPLYALDQLTAAERQWVEQQIHDRPELAAELAQYELAFTALPYGIESLPPVDRMATIKGKLFDRLDLALPTTEENPAAVPASSVVPFFAQRSDALQWRKTGIPKVEIATLYRDRAKRAQTGLLRAEPDMHYPPHHHGGVEEIYMLSGDLTLEGVTYYAGDYIRSAAGSDHAAAYSVGGCMFFFRSSLDDQYPKSLVLSYLREWVMGWVRRLTGR